MEDENNGDLEYDKHILFWRKFKVEDGRRVYGKEAENCDEANYEPVSVADLYKDLLDTLYSNLVKKFNRRLTLLRIDDARRVIRDEEARLYS